MPWSKTSIEVPAEWFIHKFRPNHSHIKQSAAYRKCLRQQVLKSRSLQMNGRQWVIPPPHWHAVTRLGSSADESLPERPSPSWDRCGISSSGCKPAPLVIPSRVWFGTPVYDASLFPALTSRSRPRAESKTIIGQSAPDRSVTTKPFVTLRLEEKLPSDRRIISTIHQPQIRGSGGQAFCF